MSRFGYLRTPTPPELLAHASPPERARVDAMLNNILTVSLRAEGLRNDTAVDKHLSAFPLESIRVPTMVISARDDRYGTYAGANAFIIRSIPTDVLRACVCLVLDMLVARTRAAGGASICGDRAVIGGRLGVEPSGGNCDGLRQRHSRAGAAHRGQCLVLTAIALLLRGERIPNKVVGPD